MAAQYPHLKIEHPVNRNGYEGPPSATILRRLEALAVDIGKTITVTSGFRSDAKQRDTCATGVRPCAPPGQSTHRYGLAADAYVGSTAIQRAVPASLLKKHGLWPLGGDPPHVEVADSKGGSLRLSLGQSTLDALYRFFSTGAKGNVAAGTKDGGILASILGGTLGPVGDAAEAALDLGGAGFDVVTGAAGGAAGDAAGAVVGLLFDTLGKEGARVLLYLALVGGGATLAYIGVARALGVRHPELQDVAVAAMTKNPSAAAAAGGERARPASARAGGAR